MINHEGSPIANKGKLLNRKPIIAYIGLLLAVAAISTFFATSSIITSEKFDRMNFIAQVRALIEKAELELQIDIVRSFEATSSLASKESLIRWFDGDENPIMKELALSEIKVLMDERGFSSAFAADLAEEQLYLGPDEDFPLSRENPDDSWFYETIEMEQPIAINVDHNNKLDQTMLWVNAQIYSKNRIIGAAGVGLNINDIHSRLASLAPGRNGMILLADNMGRIKLAHPPEMYNRNLGNVLNDKAKKYVDLDNVKSSDFDFTDSIYVISDIKNMDLKMIVVINVEDFLSSSLSMNRKYTIISIGLLFVLALALLMIIQEMKRTITQQKKNQEITIHSMSMLAELKDQETGEHLIRTSKYCRILAEELSRLPEYKNYLSRAYIKDLERSAPLHDIGKVGIPDRILQKPGNLTEEEFEVIKSHTVMGADVLRNAMSQLRYESYYKIGIQLVRHHHEKWDGSGYPDGLAGEKIPLSARIMAIADVYDALRSKRPYKKGFTHEKTIKIIIEGSGNHFEPAIVSAFERRESEFKRISRSQSSSS